MTSNLPSPLPTHEQVIYAWERTRTSRAKLLQQYPGLTHQQLNKILEGAKRFKRAKYSQDTANEIIRFSNMRYTPCQIAERYPLLSVNDVRCILRKHRRLLTHPVKPLVHQVSYQADRKTYHPPPVLKISDDYMDRLQKKLDKLASTGMDYDQFPDFPYDPPIPRPNSPIPPPMPPTSEKSESEKPRELYLRYLLNTPDEKKKFTKQEIFHMRVELAELIRLRQAPPREPYKRVYIKANPRRPILRHVKGGYITATRQEILHPSLYTKEAWRKLTHEQQQASLKLCEV